MILIYTDFISVDSNKSVYICHICVIRVLKFPVTIHKRPCSVVAGLAPAFHQPQGLLLHLAIEIATTNWVWQAAPLR